VYIVAEHVDDARQMHFDRGFVRKIENSTIIDFTEKYTLTYGNGHSGFDVNTLTPGVMVKVIGEPTGPRWETY